MNHHRPEFDDYVDFYRNAQEHAIAISGEGEEYFANLRVTLLARWFPELRGKGVSILDFGAGFGNKNNNLEITLGFQYGEG